MTGKWLSIVGIGEDGLAGLTPAAKALIDGADVLVGGERHLAMVQVDGRETLTWPRPLTSLIPKIEQHRGRKVCVLATGDPMHFGIGVTLARHLPIDETIIVPSLSAFTLACARLGWSTSEVDCLTLHGRPLDLLRAYTRPKAKLLVLTDDGEAPAQIAATLCDAGYGASRMTVLEHMDGENEGRIDGTARDWSQDRTAEFNTVAVECMADPDTPRRTRLPGLPDHAFSHDGQLTKREVRAVTISALAPVAGELLWDVGAGCGSVAVEWMRADPRNRAVAIERNSKRLGLIADNATALGAPKLDIVDGEAPAALGDLEAPDAVFVGGGLSSDAMLPACWEALPPGGRLVANAVTVEGEKALFDWCDDHDGDLSRIAISRAEPVGSYRLWRPSHPVTQYTGVKP
ncbi:MAG: precorrin-6y C5,15-methyltransferase (decarboxylating) subunit CbiE [Alphaproteobacteria bacterium]|nr:precorrin-6y C5,15-methyltransferase (decarboxylating) subunit CbiE [Alphaproteobacteria bacterium]